MNLREIRVLFLVFLLSSLTNAQVWHRLEVFGGYSYMHRDMSMVAPSGVHGWNASANWKLNNWIGVTADFSEFYPGVPCCNGSASSTGARTSTYLFGPQVSLRRPRLTPFAHFLMGYAQLTPADTGAISVQFFTSNSSFSVAAGGGADYTLSRHFALRAQADWIHAGFVLLSSLTPGRHYPPNDNVARISTGIVLRF